MKFGELCFWLESLIRFCREWLFWKGELIVFFLGSCFEDVVIKYLSFWV